MVAIFQEIRMAIYFARCPVSTEKYKNIFFFVHTSPKLKLIIWSAVTVNWVPIPGIPGIQDSGFRP